MSERPRSIITYGHPPSDEEEEPAQAETEATVPTTTTTTQTMHSTTTPTWQPQLPPPADGPIVFPPKTRKPVHEVDKTKFRLLHQQAPLRVAQLRVAAKSIDPQKCDQLAEQALKDQGGDTKAAHKQLRAKLLAKVEREQEAQGWQHVGKQRFPKQTPQPYKIDPQQVAKLKARVRAEEEKAKPQQQQSTQQPTPWGLLIPPDPNNANDAVIIPIPRQTVGTQHKSASDFLPITQIHTPGETKQELLALIEELEQKHGFKQLPKRSVIAVGKGEYVYGNVRHECVYCPRLIEIGESMARRAGVHARFTDALITATPAGGGIPPHKDHECEPNTPLLAIGLKGKRKVFFKVDGHGFLPLEGDYLSRSGAHTTNLHKVEADEFTLSITWRVKKSVKSAKSKWTPKKNNNKEDPSEDQQDDANTQHKPPPLKLQPTNTTTTQSAITNAQPQDAPTQNSHKAPMSQMEQILAELDDSDSEPADLVDPSSEEGDADDHKDDPEESDDDDGDVEIPLGNGYTLISMPTEKALSCLSRTDALEAINSMDGCNEEIRKAIEDNQQGQQRLSEALKDTLDRFALAAASTEHKLGTLKVRSKVDPGACDSIVPPHIGADYTSEETEMSKKGLNYTSAAGTPMPSYGARTLLVKTPGGKLMTAKHNVVPSTGALTSVSKLVDNGHFVGFHPDGAFIYHLATGHVEKIQRVNDCYEMGLEIVPYAQAKPLLNQVGFQGRSR